MALLLVVESPPAPEVLTLLENTENPEVPKFQIQETIKKAHECNHWPNVCFKPLDKPTMHLILAHSTIMSWAVDYVSLFFVYLKHLT